MRCGLNDAIAEAIKSDRRMRKEHKRLQESEEKILDPAYFTHFMRKFHDQAQE